MPYLLTDFETAWAFEDSDLLMEFEAGLPEYNMRVLTHFCGGFRCLTNSRRPIVTPKDLEGLVIRTPSGSLVVEETDGYRDKYARAKKWLADYENNAGNER